MSDLLVVNKQLVSVLSIIMAQVWDLLRILRSRSVLWSSFWQYYRHWADHFPRQNVIILLFYFCLVFYLTYQRLFYLTYQSCHDIQQYAPDHLISPNVLTGFYMETLTFNGSVLIDSRNAKKKKIHTEMKKTGLNEAN